MRTIADLHVHTRYSRATSREMTLAGIAKSARLKGIDVVGTGDFTHPAHFKSIKEELVPCGGGLFRLKSEKASRRPVKFMLTAEVSNIYSTVSDGAKKTRKIHSLIFAPTVEAVEKMNAAFARLGNVASDGRPIFGFSAQDLIKIVLDSSPDAMLVPAHAWTPWFSIFGSKSGFDSIEECFGPYARHIYAIETGLSSNPRMNRRVSALDKIMLISNSDAHSPAKLGREANVFAGEADYFEIMRILRERDSSKFLFTVEFFPEEGKYHFDGHRECAVVFSPEETKRAKGLCPVCGKPVTVGVSSRVEGLSDRPEGYSLDGFVPSRSMVPLDEIIAEAIGRGVNTASVRGEYERITSGATEFEVLLDMEAKELERVCGRQIALSITKVRRGELSITPGYDGEFGKVRIFGDNEGDRGKAGQIGLF
jgi:uncharacterized protein (TIGR00375 family)